METPGAVAGTAEVLPGLRASAGLESIGKGAAAVGATCGTQ